MPKYKLKLPIMDVIPKVEGLRLITIPAGAVLLLFGKPNVSGLVDAQWDALSVSVYLRDLIANGELIKEAP